jgi:hypothetical protein
MQPALATAHQVMRALRIAPILVATFATSCTRSPDPGDDPNAACVAPCVALGTVSRALVDARVGPDAIYVLLAPSRNSAADELDRLPLDGSGPQPIVTIQSPAAIEELTVDAGNLFWVEASSGSDYRILTRPLAGGAPRHLVDATEILSDLISDGTTLFFVRNNTIARVPIAGGAATDLAMPSGHINAIAANSLRLVWLDPSGIWSIAKTGGAISQVMIASQNGNLPGGYSFVVGDNDIYWAFAGTPNYFDGGQVDVGAAVMSAPVGGGPAVQLVSTAPGFAGALTLVGDRLDWLTLDAFDGPSAVSMPTQGGAERVTQISTAAVEGRLGFDADTLYFAIFPEGNAAAPTPIDRIPL